MARLIKYMGTSHVRRIDKGETWQGRLADPTEHDLVWDLDNHHVIDVEELLSDDAVELLLEDEEFKDVTDLKRIPASEGQKLWRGVKERTVNPTQVSSDDEPVVGAGVTGPNGGATASPAGGEADLGDADRGAGGAEADAAAGSTAGASPVGGSTATTGRGGRSRTT